MNKEFVSTLNDYCNKGFKVIPCGANSKIPVIKSWTENYASTIDEAISLFSGDLEYNVGIVTGKCSNLIVIDVDNKGIRSGSDSLKEIEEEVCHLPETYTVITPNGGKHLYFNYPKQVGKEMKLGCKVNVKQGVDIRCDGGFVVAPPSRINDTRYTVEEPIVDIANLPIEWVNYIYDLDISPDTKKKKIKTISRTENGGLKLTIKNAGFRLPMVIEEGERNQILLQYGSSLIGKNIPLVNVKEEVMKVNSERCSTPLTMDELASTIFKSLEQYHKKHLDSRNLMLAGIDIKKRDPREDLSPWVKISNRSGAISIDEYIYANEYVLKTHKNNIFFMNGAFVDVHGHNISLSDIEKEVIYDIGDYVPVGLSGKVSHIIDIIKIVATYDIPKEAYTHEAIFTDDVNLSLVYNEQTKRYEVSNVERTHPALNTVVPTLTKELLDERFSMNLADKAPMLHRWLTDLLPEEQRDILQEFIGYCLVPVTTCQQALEIVGDAGVGKSRIFDLLNVLIGRNRIGVTDLTKIEEDRYIANLIASKLVVYDDDLKVQGLRDTGLLKTLITAGDTTIRVQEKFERAFNLQSYAKIICCGNHMLESLYDRSEGLWRRFILLSCNPLDENRENITYNEIVARFDREKEYIFLWALLGLERLIANNWVFSHQDIISYQRDILKSNSDSILAFSTMCENLVVTGDRADIVPTTILYNKYVDWCNEVGYHTISQKTFSKSLIATVKSAHKVNICNETARYQQVVARCWKGLIWRSDEEVVREIETREALEAQEVGSYE